MNHGPAAISPSALRVMEIVAPVPPPITSRLSSSGVTGDRALRKTNLPPNGK
jgi:hypothetical protein